MLVFKHTAFQLYKKLIYKHVILCYSMLPRSTHETFAQKLYQTFKNNKRFTKPKLSRSDFTICHYAGDVCMNTFTFFSFHSSFDQI